MLAFDMAINPNYSSKVKGVALFFKRLKHFKKTCRRLTFVPDTQTHGSHHHTVRLPVINTECSRTLE